MFKKYKWILLGILVVIFIIKYSGFFPITKMIGKRSSYNSKQSIEKGKDIFQGWYKVITSFENDSIQIVEAFCERKHSIDSYDNPEFNVNMEEYQVRINFARKLFYYGDIGNWEIIGFESINPYGIKKYYKKNIPDTIIAYLRLLDKKHKIELIYTGENKP